MGDEVVRDVKRPKILHHIPGEWTLLCGAVAVLLTGCVDVARTSVAPGLFDLAPGADGDVVDPGAEDGGDSAGVGVDDGTVDAEDAATTVEDATTDSGGDAASEGIDDATAGGFDDAAADEDADAGPSDNQAPSITEAHITPEQPVAGDALECTWSGFSDPDGDDDASLVSWSINDVVVDETGTTLEGGFVGGDAVTCAVTPFDGELAGQAVAAMVVVNNTPPTVETVDIEPAEPQAGDALVCSWGGLDDVDGDSLLVEVGWDISGEPVGNQPVLPAGDHRGGDEVTCTITPFDGDDSGAPVSATVTIVNTPPTATGVQITPTSPQKGDAVTCAVDGFEDADDDADQTTYAWFIGDEELGAAAILDEAPARGSQLRCVATPSDGEDDGAPVEGVVEVANTPPVLGAIAIQPAAPTVQDDPICGVVEAPQDIDDDLVTVDYVWRINGGEPLAGATLSAPFVRGDDLECTATPADDVDEGVTVSVSVVVANAAPTATGAEISPAEPVTGDTVVCQAVGFVDADEDGDASWVEWTLDGEFAGDAAELSDPIFRGQLLACVLTPHDGTDAGEPVSVEVEVGNAPPIATHVTIEPAAPTVSDTITCLLEGYQDPEEDASASLYSWTIGDTGSSTTPELTDPVAYGQTVTCSVTPSDGTASGPELSASVTIANSLPTLDAATITPVAPGAGDVVTCAGEGYADGDEHPDQSTFEWFVNGESVADGPELSGLFVRGDTLRCDITPHDGVAAGQVVTAAVPVVNTPPEVLAATITPESPVAGSTISCVVDPQDLVDIDQQDDLTVFTTWYVNESLVGQGDTLPASVVADDLVLCVVTPFDGLQAGTPVEVETTVVNTPPTAAGLSILPAAPLAGQQLTCAVTGYADADGHSDQSLLSWTINGDHAGTGPTLDAAFVHEDVIECATNLSDGHSDGAPLSAQVAVANSIPVATGAAIDPASPRVGEEVSCAVVDYSDADGEDDSSGYQWFIGGSAFQTGSVLPAAPARGVTVECRVTPNDGHADGVPVSSFATVVNSEPTIEGALIDPEAFFAGDQPSCGADGWSDADGDIDQSTIAWSVSGEPAGSGPLLEQDVVHGDTVVCEVTPHDGLEAGTPKSSSVSVSNTPPSVAGVTLDPPTPIAGQPIVCDWSGFYDADGEADQSTVQWQVGDTTTIEGAVLPAGAFGVGDTVLCIVTPHDGTSAGEQVAKGTLVGNVAPTIETVEIDPPAVVAGEILTCSYAGYFDLEGNDDESRYLWSVNGLPAGDSATLDAGFVGGDTVTCQVTPSDGSDGTPVSASVVVSNTPPTLSGASIDPPVVRAGDTVHCTWQGYEDADGDADQSLVQWSHDGSPTSTEPVWSGPYVRGDEIQCEVTAFDGLASGDTGTATITVTNTAPSIGGAAIDPSEPRDDDVLTCAAVDYLDADGDASASEVQWLVNGADAGDGDTLSSGFTGGDLVTCVVVAHDGYNAGNTRSSAVEIISTAPTIDSVSVEPDHPTVDSVLTCAWEGFDAIDGDPDQSTVAWWIGEDLVGTGLTLEDAFVKDQVVTCTVTPFDGVRSGVPVSAGVTVVNAKPMVLSVHIDPDSPLTNDVASAVVEVHDPDGDEVSLTYSWTVDGDSALCSGQDCYGIVAFSKGQKLRVAAQPFDGSESGSWAPSTVVTIANSVPGVPEIGFSEPVANPPGDDIECLIEVEAEDEDEESLTYSYSWTVDGAASGVTASVVPSEMTASGETWRCRVQASDDEASGAPVEASIIVGTAWTEDMVEKTTWIAESSPYILGADIEIPTAFELIIKEGVEVFGQGHAILVSKKLEIGNSDTSKPMVIVHDLVVQPLDLQDSDLEVAVYNTWWMGGQLLPVAPAGETNKVKIHDSVFTDMLTPIVILDAGAESQVYRNVFVSSGGLVLGSTGATTKVNNNVWFEQTTPAVDKLYGETSKFEFKENSLLSMDRLAISLAVGGTGGFVANDNYWSTMDQAVIDDMIFDQLDDPGSPAVVEVTSVLDAPDDSTPDASPYLP